MPNDAFSLFSQIIVAGGGLALLVYQIFKHLAAKWLDNRFEKNFQNLLHEQNKELEKLKTELTKSFDRATKLHQREFEILPDVWSKLNNAYWTTQSLVSPIQTYPDLDRMQPQQLHDFVQGCDFADWQKSELITSSRKSEYYREAIYWHRLHAAKTAFREASICLSNGGIFIRTEIQEKLNDLLDLMWGAIVEDEINQSITPRSNLSKDTEKLRKDGDTLRKRIEEEIKNRLWSPE